MQQATDYLDLHHHPVISIVKGVDKDVAHSEDILMLGYAMVLMAPLFAPVMPPHVLLPLMAFTFVLSVCWARLVFYSIKRKLKTSLERSQHCPPEALSPILTVFAEHPKHSLTDGFNPLKNLARTAKSLLGALLINPFWMPVFYTLGLQFIEEKQTHALNMAVIKIENKHAGIATPHD